MEDTYHNFIMQRQNEKLHLQFAFGFFNKILLRQHIT